MLVNDEKIAEINGYICRIDRICTSAERKIQTLFSSAAQQELTPSDPTQVIKLLKNQSQRLQPKLEFLDEKATLVRHIPEEYGNTLALRASVCQQLEEVKNR